MKPCIACRSGSAPPGKPYCSPCWTDLRIKQGKAPRRRGG